MVLGIVFPMVFSHPQWGTHSHNNIHQAHCLQPIHYRECQLVNRYVGLPTLEMFKETGWLFRGMWKEVATMQVQGRSLYFNRTQRVGMNVRIIFSSGNGYMALNSGGVRPHYGRCMLSSTIMIVNCCLRGRIK